MREADRWLGFAKQDLRVAELAMSEGLYNQVCFHAEQCVEKVLKAWLAEKGKKIPRTHSMADLLTIIPANVVSNMSEEILLLDRFYIPTRYPDALPGSLEDGMPSKEEAQEALNLGKRVLEHISSYRQTDLSHFRWRIDNLPFSFLFFFRFSLISAKKNRKSVLNGFVNRLTV